MSLVGSLFPQTGGNDAPARGGEDLVRIDARALIGLRHAAESLPLKSVRILGTMAGPHLSAFKGRGMEFDESRPYQPGDDVRNLDWRVMARSGRPHTKLYREERERSVLLWVDLRRPMFFATQGAFKAVVAARATALLAWSAARHGDRVGGLIFSERGRDELRPRLGKKGVLHLIRLLEAHPTGGAGGSTGKNGDGLHAATARLRRVAHPGSLVFLISDFRHLDERSEAQIVQLAQHSDLVLIQVHDRLERELPVSGRYRFSDGVRSLTLDAGSREVRKNHQVRFEEHVARLQNLCRRSRMYLLPCATDVDLVPHLRSGLGLRSQ